MAFLIFTYFGIISIFFLNGAKYVYRNKYLALLSAWIFLNIFLNFVIPFCTQLKEAGRVVNVSILEQMVCFILGLFVSYIILSSLEKEDYLRIAKALCLSSALVASWAILQKIGFDPFGRMAVYSCDNRVSACLDNPNVVGNYLVLCLPLYFIFNQKKYIIGVLLTTVGIGVTNSHFAIVLAFLGLFIFAFNYYKNVWIKVWLVSSSVFASILLWNSNFAKLDCNMSGRLDCWKVALKHLKDNVLFGQGLGCWKTFNDIYIKTTWWMSVHNDWLEKAIEIGIVGVILILLVVVNTIRNCKFKNIENCAFFSMFIVFLVMMAGSFPIVTPTIGFLGLISWLSVERL